MSYPVLRTDLSKITENARTVRTLASGFGIDIMAVVKGVCASPEVAGAIVSAGIHRLADSRLLNIKRLRDAGIDAHLTLLRSPMPSEVAHAASLADRVMVSDANVLNPLSGAALATGKTLEVVLMVDLGDLREGFWPYSENWHDKIRSPSSLDTLEQAIDALKGLDGLRLCGIGVNLTCFGAIIPTVSKMKDLIGAAEHASALLGRGLGTVSGGNSANMGLLVNGTMPAGITELRIGESILLGTEPVLASVVPGCHTGAFTLDAEVIEVRRKPSIPFGCQGVDAFGKKPVFEDRGVRLRAIVAIGRQDCDVEDMRPQKPGITILGASSDHLVLDVEDYEPAVCTGDIIGFDIGYPTLLKATTSEYVKKAYC